jgi:hypothetical protein
MTGYWAHYTTRCKKDGKSTDHWTDTFPVVGYTDVALVINPSGEVKTVQAMREELAGDGTLEDGETFTVTLEVNTWDGE